MALIQKLAFINKSILQKATSPFCTSLSLQLSLKEPAPKKVVKIKPSSDLPSTSIKAKVRQGVTDFGYSAIILGGVALTGLIFYVIIRELFSGKSPTSVYEEALKICTSDVRVQDLLGSSITGCGETNRRGRRTHVASSSWVDHNNRKHMAMRFYLKGNYASGTVHLEVYENEKNEYEYRYLVVEVEGLTRKQVLLRPESIPPTDSPAPSSITPFENK